MNDIFLNAAISVAEYPRYSCVVLDNLNISTELLELYESMFAHDIENCGDRSLGWWDVEPTDAKAHELRVMSLLLAHELYMAGDL